MKNTVYELRKQGIKVTVFHRRKTEIVDGEEIAASKGGETEVYLDFANGKSFLGLAHCSKMDSYNRKLGVQIATGRALKDAKQAGVYSK